jgi:hypothetical protein
VTVSARWALAGTVVSRLAKPFRVTLRESAGARPSVPATAAHSALVWRSTPRCHAVGRLGPGQEACFLRVTAAEVVFLTRRLSHFALLRPTARLRDAVVVTTPRVALYSRRYVGVRLTAPRAVEATWTLLTPAGVPLQQWRRRLPAGASTTFLGGLRRKPLLPTGTYTLETRIAAGGVRHVEFTPIRLARTGGWVARRPAGIARVVLADPTVARAALAGRLGGSFALSAAGGDVFTAGRGAEIAVVPAGPLVRQLRLVLPELRLVVVARTAAEAAAARRAGASATVVAPRSATVIARAVAAVATRTR